MAAAVRIWPTGRLTMLTSAAVSAGQSLVITGDETCAGAAGANKSFLGIAGEDAASGAYVEVLCTGPVYDVTTSGTVNAGDVIETAASAKFAAHTEGTNDDRVVGLAIKAAASNVTRVMFYRGA